MNRRRARRVCEWCRASLEVTARSDARTCSQRCRQALWRFTRERRHAEVASQPKRLAYADPPYPGKAHLYPENQEVNHALLVSLLEDFDGWALSTSAEALPRVLGLCPLDVRVAAWFRGSRHNAASRRPSNGWEPVIYRVARNVSAPARHDALVFPSRPRTTDPERVIGAKPAAFAFWMFELIGARVGDSLADVYPGSGGVGRAWRLLQASAPGGRDTSPPGGCDG